MTRRGSASKGRGLRWIGVAFVLVTLVAGLAAIAPNGVGGGPSPGVRGGLGSGWITDVVVEGAALSQRNPSIASGPGGVLLMVFENTTSGNADVQFSMSADAGLTWTLPVAIANTGTAEVNPDVSFDPFSGRMFVTYQIGTAGATTIGSAYSDDGATWTTGTAFACGVLCTRPRIVSEYWRGASNYQYIAFAGEIAFNDWDVAVLRSIDEGLSWEFRFEDDSAVGDVRWEPEIAVQRGTDAVDRVMVFYRAGATTGSATNGYMVWSEDYAVSWLARSQWSVGVATAPTMAASHDGDSVMIAYSTTVSGFGNIIWAIDQDPTDLTWGTSTSWNQWTATGYWPALGVDGDGSTDTTIGGRYHLVAHDGGGQDLLYMSAHTTMTMQSDWSAPAVLTDTNADASDSYRLKSVSTQFRGTAWEPVLAWADFRNAGASQDVYYGTTGSHWSFDTIPAGLSLTVDGTPRPVPFTLSFPAGTTHTLSAPGQTGAGVRSTWLSWSDGGAQTHTVTATPADAAFVATFSTEYLLTLVSSQSGVSGAGWYLANSLATITATSPQSAGPGTRYVFAAWTGDLISYQTSATLTMNAPKTITANWRTEYELNVTSPHGNVTGDGWYAAGTNAQLRVESRVVTEGGRTWQFTGWSGDITGNGTTLQVTMTGPKSVTANWREQPTGLFAGPGGALVLVAILLAVLFLILALVMWRKRRKPQPAFQQMHPVGGIGMPPPTAPPAQPPQQPMPPWPEQPPGNPPP